MKSEIRKAIERDDLQRADIAARTLLARDGTDAELLLLMAQLAGRLERHVIQAEFLTMAHSLGAPALPQPPEVRTARDDSVPRYLVAIEWGYGFWADVAHVLGSLLLAEMTRRIPLVHWSNASLFSPGDGEDAWRRYFRPIGPDRHGLPQGGYYPPPWTGERALGRDFRGARQQRGPGMHGLALLPRRETVVVSDTFVGINDLWAWLQPADVDHGTSALDIKRRLAEKYLKLQPHIAAQIEAFWAEHMRGRSWLGVHIRGTDKVTELADLQRVNGLYFDEIDRRLQLMPDAGIFLLTDSAPDHEAIRSRYCDRVLTTDATRMQGRIGVHYSGGDPVKLAEQVLVDTYLATRCDSFLGNGSSNVSLAVEYLKRWPPGTYQLLGPDWRGVRFAL